MRFRISPSSPPPRQRASSMSFPHGTANAFISQWRSSCLVFTIVIFTPSGMGRTFEHNWQTRRRARWKPKSVLARSGRRRQLPRVPGACLHLYGTRRAELPAAVGEPPQPTATSLPVTNKAASEARKGRRPRPRRARRSGPRACGGRCRPRCSRRRAGGVIKGGAHIGGVNGDYRRPRLTHSVASLHQADNAVLAGGVGGAFGIPVAAKSNPMLTITPRPAGDVWRAAAGDGRSP